LDLRVRGLAHVDCGVDKDLFSLNLAIDLVDEVVIVHGDGFLASWAVRHAGRCGGLRQA